MGMGARRLLLEAWVVGGRSRGIVGLRSGRCSVSGRMSGMVRMWLGLSCWVAGWRRLCASCSLWS